MSESVSQPRIGIWEWLLPNTQPLSKRERSLNKLVLLFDNAENSTTLLYNQNCNLYSNSSTSLTNGGVQDVDYNKPRQTRELCDTVRPPGVTNERIIGKEKIYRGNGMCSCQPTLSLVCVISIKNILHCTNSQFYSCVTNCTFPETRKLISCFRIKANCKATLKKDNCFLRE